MQYNKINFKQQGTNCGGKMSRSCVTDWIHGTSNSSAGKTTRVIWRSRLKRSLFKPLSLKHWDFSIDRCQCYWYCFLLQTVQKPHHPGTLQSRRSACWSTTRDPDLSCLDLMRKCWAGGHQSPQAHLSATCRRRESLARNWGEQGRKRKTEKIQLFRKVNRTL